MTGIKSYCDKHFIVIREFQIHVYFQIRVTANLNWSRDWTLLVALQLNCCGKACFLYGDHLGIFLPFIWMFSGKFGLGTVRSEGVKQISGVFGADNKAV